MPCCPSDRELLPLTTAHLYGILVLLSRRHPVPLAPEQPHKASKTYVHAPSQRRVRQRGSRRIPAHPCRFGRPPCQIVAVSCRDLATFAAHDAQCYVAIGRKPA